MKLAEVEFERLVATVPRRGVRLANIAGDSFRANDTAGTGSW